jgi:hypothetical protein
VYPQLYPRRKPYSHKQQKTRADKSARVMRAIRIVENGYKQQLGGHSLRQRLRCPFRTHGLRFIPETWVTLLLRKVLERPWGPIFSTGHERQTFPIKTGVCTENRFCNIADERPRCSAAKGGNQSSPSVEGSRNCDRVGPFAMRRYRAIDSIFMWPKSIRDCLNIAAAIKM